MPQALEYIPPTDSRRSIFDTAAISERTLLRRRYRTALKYYYGDHPQQLPSVDGVDDNTYLNLVKMTADRTASFLFTTVPTVQTDPRSLEDTSEEAFLKECLDNNGGLEFLHKLALRGFMAGHSYIKVRPPLVTNGYPRMTILDPTNVLMYTYAEDVSTVFWYEVRQKVGDVYVLQDFVRNPDNTWTVYTYHSEARAAYDFRVFDSIHDLSLRLDAELDSLAFGSFKLVSSERHNFEIPPIIDIPHLPDPDSIIGANEVNQVRLQDTINRVMSEMNRIIRENADPVDVVTGADVQEIQDDGGIISIPSPTAKLTRLEMRGDITGIRNTLDKLIEIYLTVARVVLLKGDVKDLQRVTNASVRTLFLDAIAKNELLKSSYGTGLQKAFKLMLMFGYKSGKITANPMDLPVTILFTEPLPTDKSEIANINAIQVGLGARSLATAARAIGDDWHFEHEAMVIEHTEKMARQAEQMEMEAQAQPEATPSVYQASQSAAAQATSSDS